MKTPIDFEYDFIPYEKDGKKQYRIVIKATGETVEISDSVMKYLRTVEKKVRRDIKNTADRSSRDVSLDALSSDNSEAPCLCDTFNLEEAVWNKYEFEKFRKTLTIRQKSVLEECLFRGLSQEQYAKKYGISKSAVSKIVMLIRKKIVNFL